jgi:hypothetical protein
VSLMLFIVLLVFMFMAVIGMLVDEDNKERAAAFLIYSIPLKLVPLFLNHLTTCFKKTRKLQGTILITFFYVGGAEIAIQQNTVYFTLSYSYPKPETPY